jgi:hypothetical protein
MVAWALSRNEKKEKKEELINECSLPPYPLRWYLCRDSF